MELMIVVAILGVVVSVGSRLFIQTTRFVRLSSARSEIQRDARMALANMNREIRQAQASSVVVDQAAGQPPQSRITFTRYKPDGSSQTVSYYQQGKKLYLQVGAQAGRAIAENLRYIAFTYPKTDDGTIISVSVTFEKATYEAQTKSLQMAVEKVRIMNS